MKSPKYGCKVYGVEGNFVGSVGGVNGCCIEVLSERGRFTVTRDAAYFITGTRIELACSADEVARYACKAHPH